MPPIERIYTLQETADVLGITVPELSELIRAGQLEADAAKHRVRESDLRAYKLAHWPAEGFSTVMGGSLQIEVFGKEWSLAVWPLENSAPTNFYSFHRKRLTPADIRLYVGDPEALEWRSVGKLFPGVTEYVATTPSYRINLVMHGSDPLPLDQAKGQLEHFLACG